MEMILIQQYRTLRHFVVNMLHRHTFSVGYDTVKLYHDTDADTFTGKVS